MNFINLLAFQHIHHANQTAYLYRGSHRWAYEIQKEEDLNKIKVLLRNEVKMSLAFCVITTLVSFVTTLMKFSSKASMMFIVFLALAFILFNYFKFTKPLKERLLRLPKINKTNPGLNALFSKVAILALVVYFAQQAKLEIIRYEKQIHSQERAPAEILQHTLFQ